MEHSLSLKPDGWFHPRCAVAGETPKLSFAAQGWQAWAQSEIISQWDALAEAAADPNPFYESWYLLPSLRAFDPQGAVTLLTLTADGQLAGLLPIRRDSHYYGHRLPHWRNWGHANCFLGHPLVARGFERMFWRELLNWADQQGGFEVFVHLAHCPIDGPLHEALRAELASRPAATVLSEERALLKGDLTPEGYLEASLNGKKRKELRRQQRRLGEEGKLLVERLDDTIGVSEWVQEFLALEARGWKGASESALACDPRTADLFAEALLGAALRGKLERLALRLDGKPIAMLASFMNPPGACSFKTAFDEDYARFSPGVLLQIENLAMLSRPGIEWVDSCAAEDHPMIDHFWRDRRTVARHSIGIGGALRRALFALIARKETGSAARGIL